MRIAYVTEWSPWEPSGVLRKMIGQVRLWKSLGCDARIFALAPTRNQGAAFDFFSHGVVVGRIAQERLDQFPSARLGFVNKVLSAGSLGQSVAMYQPDVIYYRQQGPWYPGIGRVLRLAPAVAELNGSKAAELIWGLANAGFRALTDRHLWRHLRGFVAVSPDIEREYRSLKKPIAVIPNSLWGPVCPLPPTGNTAPAFVFVGSPLINGGAWHGVDKIMQLAKALPDSSFHIVGLRRDEASGATPASNVTFHGPLYGEALKKVYEVSDVGIGTLALHRRSIETNSALKPLEYLMHGLPVILGYLETDDRLNRADYTLLISNRENNVAEHISEITAFAAAWRNRRVTADLSYLSGNVIEQRRLSFLRQLAGRPGMQETGIIR